MSRALPPPRRRKSQAARLARTLLFVAVVVVLYYASTAGPARAAQAKAEVADGALSVEVADGVTVTPAADWLTEPLVHTLVAIPVLPDLRSWAVYFGAHTGTLLRSPDRQLTVEIDSHGPGSAEDAEALLRDRAGSLADEGPATAAIRTETLASGSPIWHLDAESALLAVIDRNGDLVTVIAEHTAGGPIDAYRPAIGQLLATVR